MGVCTLRGARAGEKGTQWVSEGRTAVTWLRGRTTDISCGGTWGSAPDGSPVSAARGRLHFPCLLEDSGAFGWSLILSLAKHLPPNSSSAPGGADEEF